MQTTQVSLRKNKIILNKKHLKEIYPSWKSPILLGSLFNVESFKDAIYLSLIDFPNDNTITLQMSNRIVIGNKYLKHFPENSVFNISFQRPNFYIVGSASQEVIKLELIHKEK